MCWQIELIRLYEFLSEEYHSHLWPFCQRFSNHNKPNFSDVEVLTVYLFGLKQGHRELKKIHFFTHCFLNNWFPNLPSYVSFVRRLNRLEDLFPVLIERLQPRILQAKNLAEVYIVDSFPVIMANGKRALKAKVAAHFANKGKCASKGVYYYGLKVHIIAIRVKGHMPIPVCIGLSPAADNDLTLLKIMLPYFRDASLYGDKIYLSKPLMEQLIQEQNLQLLTPVKKKKKQTTDLDMFQKLLSRSVSGIRQPIESLFNWINEKTNIQNASKVRSWRGVMVQTFGRIAAAMITMMFNM